MNEYLVIGYARRDGALGLPDDFQIERQTDSSRTAYVQVRDALYNNGHESVNVVAIKMKSPFTGEFTITVPSELYLQ